MCEGSEGEQLLRFIPIRWRNPRTRRKVEAAIALKEIQKWENIFMEDIADKKLKKKEEVSKMLEMFKKNIKVNFLVRYNNLNNKLILQQPVPPPKVALDAPAMSIETKELLQKLAEEVRDYQLKDLDKIQEITNSISG